MPTVIIFEKTGEIKSSDFQPGKDELYKKCKFRKNENFELRNTWIAKKKYSFKYVEVWARNTGKAGTENKYDFPPPIDNELYFGSCVAVAKNDNHELVDLNEDEWNKYYEELFGGFENLDDMAKEDELEVDELDEIPSEMKTKSGYLKDGFIVDDEDDEDEDLDNTSDLDFEEYMYSDEN